MAGLYRPGHIRELEQRGIGNLTLGELDILTNYLLAQTSKNIGQAEEGKHTLERFNNGGDSSDVETLLVEYSQNI